MLYMGAVIGSGVSQVTYMYTSVHETYKTYTCHSICCALCHACTSVAPELSPLFEQIPYSISILSL